MYLCSYIQALYIEAGFNINSLKTTSHYNLLSRRESVVIVVLWWTEGEEHRGVELPVLIWDDKRDGSVVSFTADVITGIWNKNHLNIKIEFVGIFGVKSHLQGLIRSDYILIMGVTENYAGLFSWFRHQEYFEWLSINQQNKWRVSNEVKSHPTGFFCFKWFLYLWMDRCKIHALIYLGSNQWHSKSQLTVQRMSELYIKCLTAYLLFNSDSKIV